MPKEIVWVCKYCSGPIYKDHDKWAKCGTRYVHERCVPFVEEETIETKVLHYVKDVCGEVNKSRVHKQFIQFKEKGFTENGILMSLKYAYDVKKLNPTKSGGGIGIVPYIYEEARRYWETVYDKNKVVNDIKSGKLQVSPNKTKVITIKKKKKDKKDKLLPMDW